ncbi:hypothetical protein BJ508DRAFT_75723 [Ascobolus immersus RN42]|uniref:Uncharacterized protein n=1 Tax=Ascobolus immersus RN42 TaxID=1160509 RepID=A0A3N4HDK3_ASCIM|nr:hypothetical protein BJ508DRAFT_75723 [Ascobolus immersus RN42]
MLLETNDRLISGLPHLISPGTLKHGKHYRPPTSTQALHMDSKGQEAGRCVVEAGSKCTGHVLSWLISHIQEFFQALNLLQKEAVRELLLLYSLQGRQKALDTLVSLMGHWHSDSTFEVFKTCGRQRRSHFALDFKVLESIKKGWESYPRAYFEDLMGFNCLHYAFSSGMTGEHFVRRSGLKSFISSDGRKAMQSKDISGRTPLHVLADSPTGHRFLADRFFWHGMFHCSGGVHKLKSASVGRRLYGDCCWDRANLSVALAAVFDLYGYAPIHIAVKKGDIHFIKAIEVGLVRKARKPPPGTAEPVDVWNAPDIRRYTPLHLAVIYSQQEMVGHLLDLGGDPSLRDGMEQSAFDRACSVNYDRMIDLGPKLRRAMIASSFRAGDWEGTYWWGFKKGYTDCIIVRSEATLESDGQAMISSSWDSMCKLFFEIVGTGDQRGIWPRYWR